MADEELPTWSGIADWYDDLLTAGSGPHETALQCLLDLSPDLDGVDVLDVACGQGIVARALAANGAVVTAIDFAEGMIANARHYGTPKGSEISYAVDDGETLSTVADSSQDGVTCQLGLMDLGDLDACLQSIARVLRPNGWITFVIAHPAFLAPDAERVTAADGRPAAAITGYFDERFWRSLNPNGVRRAGNYHRTMSSYLNALHQAGFHIEQAHEPPANELLAQQQPLYSHVPIFFAARARLLNQPTLDTTLVQ